jgi:hypothetical protein
MQTQKTRLTLSWETGGPDKAKTLSNDEKASPAEVFRQGSVTVQVFLLIIRNQTFLHQHSWASKDFEAISPQKRTIEQDRFTLKRKVSVIVLC